MIHARAGHTATLLPDGTVLILGGIGLAGQVVAQAEQFDTAAQAFQPVATPGLTPRAWHTATLLTEGLVLVAGGVEPAGALLGGAELWNPFTRTGEATFATLASPRQKSAATLLPDGTVLLWGGEEAGGAPLANGEVFDPAAQRFTLVLSRPPGAEPPPVPPSLAASLPPDGTQDVPVDSVLVVRFSKPLDVTTVGAGTVTLAGPRGPVTALVVPAEGGRLGFVTPEQPLLPSTSYTLTLNGPADPAGFLLPFTTLVFRTAAPPVGEPPGQPPHPPGPWHQPPVPQPPPPPPGAQAEVDAWEWTGARDTDGKPHSPWQDLAALQALPGITALTGQVLRLDGEPLPGVTLAIGERLAVSDQAGRFLLIGIPEGYQPLLIMGFTANSPGRTYGMFEYGVGVRPGETTRLDFTIWMPLLDTQNAIPLPGGPTQRPIVGRTPRIPGLEVHIPAGVTFRSPDGNYLQSISLTPVPLDRTPFPLPPGARALIVPQGHGTTVETVDGHLALSGKGVRVIFPAAPGDRPGERFGFGSYEPHAFGWYTWGEGVVTPDGRQIAAGPRDTLSEIGCYWVKLGPSPAWAGPNPIEGVAEPVDPSTGLFVLEKVDLVVPDVIPIVFRRGYHSSRPPYAHGVGKEVMHDYEVYLTGDGQSYQWAELILATGVRVKYLRTSPGTGYTDAVLEHTASPTRFYKSVLAWNPALGQWELTFKDGTRWQFLITQYGLAPSLWKVLDRVGNVLSVTRDIVTGLASRITTPNGRWVELAYDFYGLSQVRDHAGRTVGYGGWQPGGLGTVTDPAGGGTTYTYDGANRLRTIRDARGIVFLTNEYTAEGRVWRQTQADGTTWGLSYTVDGQGKVTQAEVTDPRGVHRVLTFNGDGYPVTDTRAVNQPEQQVVVYDRQPGTNLVTAVTDALGRRTEYTYDPKGNVLTVTRLAGTPDAVTTTFTYEPTWSQVQTVTDPLGHTTTFGYDPQGNLTTITDPLGKVTTLTYTGQGQPFTITDPKNNTWTLGYTDGDLTSVKDPLNKVTARGTDTLGRLVALTDPLGNRTGYAWDSLNRLTQITDALNGLTTFGYDPNGNLTSVTDARQNTTTYTPDLMDRLQSRTDALQHGEGYTYDPNGNLWTFTDRKGQTSTRLYDPLDRLGTVTWQDGSTATYTWDGGNRLTQIVDSQSGTITRGYDGLDRLKWEQTPQGRVDYTYDAAGRRATLTVLGQATVTYGYDNADRLASVTQGAAAVTMAYDDAGRRQRLTLPNNVRALYDYDKASRLTSITFKKGTATLGDLSYTYDTAGRRTSIGGTWARTGIPQPLTSATYNANNQQIAWGGVTQTFDLNGNLQTDAAGTTYTWDARDRLTGISGPGLTASFTYDALGRRTGKTINGVTTSVLYDGLNPVQELSGAQVLANLLTGLGLDEYFTRTDGSGRRSLLADALGSILALTDDAGVVQTSYTYEPFGGTTASGQASTNAFQYTGRENDGTGLYYYRARYYSPTVQRFLSEDPIGILAGDPSFYAYVANAPVRFVDPLGLDKQKCQAAGSPGSRVWILVVLSGGGGWLFGAGEVGEYFLVDPFSGEAHAWYFGSLGLGLGIGGAVQVEGGFFRGPADPSQMSNWSLAVNALAAVGYKGVSGQFTGTSFWGRGEGGWSVGHAAGAGYGISGMATRSFYRGRRDLLPERFRDIVERLGRQCVR